ncbi:MAG: YHS domain-containing protein [Deltaproteobacteria bacterium]|nr:YHS domain-containing protein [Deltaproteobacteria bacterium]MBW2099030.1 YHS domain-containing protein [Deltaproteobacteria bacterium]
MLRLILLSVLFLALYYVIKGFFKGIKLRSALKAGSGQAGKRTRTTSRQPPPITDELVRDPVCGVYCPKRDALSLNRQGKTYYFCSDKCRQEFREQKNNL